MSRPTSWLGKIMYKMGAKSPLAKRPRYRTLAIEVLEGRIVPNAAPIAVVDSYSVSQGQTLNVAAVDGLLANDTDEDIGDTLTAINLSQPGHGWLMSYSNGGFYYGPNSGYSGTDSFTYKANDGTADSNTITVTITVTGGSGSNSAPVANNDGTYNVSLNQTLNLSANSLLANDTDADGNSLTAIVVSQPSHGYIMPGSNGDFNYYPFYNYSGSDSFTYKANDGIADSNNTATVSLFVGNANTPPTLGSVSLDNAAPKTNDVLTATVGSPYDADGNAITFNYVWTVNCLTVKTTSTTATTNTLNLSAAGNGNRGDTISVSVTPSDASASGNSVTASASVMNSAPTAAGGTQSVNENSTLTVPVSQLFTDADSDTLTASIDSAPSSGDLTINSDGSITYTPDPDFTGTDSFTLSVSDGAGGSTSHTFTCNVAAPSSTGVVAASDTFTVGQGATLTSGAVLANDFSANGLPLYAIIVTQPIHGYLMSANGDSDFRYETMDAYTGPDSFTYMASDGTELSEPATVAINIVHYAPPNADGSFSTTHDFVLANIDFSPLDSDANGDPVQVDIDVGGQPTHGTIARNSDGTFNYTPNFQWTGTDSVTIIKSMYGNNTSGNYYGPWQHYVVPIHVTNIKPVAKHTEVPIEAYNQIADGLDLLADATDSDNDSLTVDIVSGPAHGSLDLNYSTGIYAYHGAISYVGLDSFSVRYFDGVEYSATVNVSILNYDDSVATNDPLIRNFAGVGNALYTGNPEWPQQLPLAQGSANNDCWLVAAMASAAGKWGEWIKDNMITDNLDGTFRVRWPGVANFVTVTPALTPANESYSTANGDWSKILEMGAAAYYRTRGGNGPFAYDYINTPGFPSTGLRLVTGHTVDPDCFYMTRNSVTREKLTTAFAANKLVTALSSLLRQKGIEGVHVYSVLGFDETTDTVHLRNPWGHNNGLAWNDHGITLRRPNRDAVADFWMPLPEFTSIFTSIAYEE